MLLIVFEAQAGWAAAALLAMALPGLAGAFGPTVAWRRTGLLAGWAFAAAGAIGLTGGLSGPFAVFALAPLLAAVALGEAAEGRRLWALAGALPLAVLVPTAIAQAQKLTGEAAGAPLDSWLALAALGGSAAAGAAALRRRSGPARAAPVDASLIARLADAERAAAAAQTAAAAAETGREQAQAQAVARSRFLANMSHELRTPLNAVIGFSDIMRARLFGPLSDKYGEYAQLIHESGLHLLDLINDVLDMSKIEAERYELSRESFDARDAINAALRLLRVQADEAQVQLRGLLPPEPIPVEADRRAIKQMVLNLVSNALKFTPAGGWVTVTAEPRDGALELTVADTGVGIAEEDLARLGRPFEQAGGDEARAQGTGLGLSLVKAFAGLHGGGMAIESRLGEGTAVTVTLPVLEPAPAFPAAGAEVTEARTPSS